MVIRTGNAVDVIDRLHHEVRFDRIVSHQETGNLLTYKRDRAVRRWARHHGVTWTEFVVCCLRLSFWAVGWHGIVICLSLVYLSPQMLRQCDNL